MVAALDLLGAHASAQPLDLRRRRADARAAFEAAEAMIKEVIP